MTAEEYATFINQKQQETDALLEEAKGFTHTLFTPEKYVEYLNLVSRFHRYSFLNVLLIQLQFSDASYISGFETWKTVAMETFNDTSYQILSRAYIGKGIKILVPFTVNSATSGSKVRYLIHIPVSVYDVNQTNNLPLPEEDLLTIDVVDRHLAQALRSNTPHRYILVDHTDKYIQSGMRSYFDKMNQFILIDDSLSETDRMKEYIHTWIKKEVYDLFKQKNISDTYFGCATSSAEYVVRTALKLNVTDIAFNYVSQYATVNDADMWTILHVIQIVSHSVVERITEDVLEMKELSEADWMDGESIADYDFLGIGVD